MKNVRIVLMLLFVVIMAGFVSAATNVNITLRETVNQNVTYAKYFYLVENRTYALIEGEVEVNNPSAETVFDIFIRLSDVTEIVDGTFYWRDTSDREGYQVIFPSPENVSNLNTTNVGATYVSLHRDLDEDGINDSVKVNDTHIIFNITSEPYEYVFGLEDNGVPVDIGLAGQDVNMEITLTSSEKQQVNPLTGVTYATMTINGTTILASALNFTSDLLNVTLNDSARAVAVLHIPELRSGQNVFFNYNVSLVNIQPPADINTSYEANTFNTKVLAGELFNITTYISNIGYVAAPINNMNITIRMLSVNVTNLTNPAESQLFNFTIHDLRADGDYKNVYSFNSTSTWFTVYNNATDASNLTWYWYTNGGTLPHLNTYNISYSIRAPDTVPTSESYEAVYIEMAYVVPTTASNLTVTEVRARGDVDFTETKRIISPASAVKNYNVTWQSIATVSTESGINFTLEEVTQWVTTSLNPNNRSSGYNLNKTFTVNGDLNAATPWSSSGASPFMFNFTEGTNGTDVPIIWVKPYWIIKNANNQIINQSISVNGTDIYIMSIYVVHGYYLRVDKNISNIGNSTYRIYTEVRNLGNGHTPQNQTVTIYDFVPNDFTAYGWADEGGTPDASDTVSGDFDGTAYQWDVGMRTNLSTSFSSRGSADGYDFWNVTYFVNGTGDYRVSELYIVGLDPRNLDGVYGSPAVSIFSGLQSGSREFIWIIAVLGLIVINIGNLIMTRRINKKIDERLKK